MITSKAALAASASQLGWSFVPKHAFTPEEARAEDAPFAWFAKAPTHRHVSALRRLPSTAEQLASLLSSQVVRRSNFGPAPPPPHPAPFSSPRTRLAADQGRGQLRGT